MRLRVFRVRDVEVNGETVEVKYMLEVNNVIVRRDYDIESGQESIDIEYPDMSIILRGDSEGRISSLNAADYDAIQKAGERHLKREEYYTKNGVYLWNIGV